MLGLDSRAPARSGVGAWGWGTSPNWEGEHGMDVIVMETDTGLRLMCEWFVMCDRPAEWAAQGAPVTGMVPICQRCADRVGLTPDELYPYELTTED